MPLQRHYLNLLKNVGCDIRQWNPALKLLTEDQKVVGARTSEGDFFADVTIVAAGAWSTSLLRDQVHLPVYPVKGQMCSMRSEEVSIQRIIQSADGMIIPRLDGTLTVGVTHEMTGYHKESTVSGISRVFDAATRMVPKLNEAEFLNSWAGCVPAHRIIFLISAKWKMQMVYL